MRIRVSRRTFMAQSGAVATALCVPSFIWAKGEKEDDLVFPDVSELVKQLPPKARFVPRPLPDAENGYLAYRKALDAVVGTDVLFARLKAEQGDKATMMKYDGLIAPEETTFPEGREGEIIENWLDENDSAHERWIEASHFTRGFISPKRLEKEFVDTFSNSASADFLLLRSMFIEEELRLLRALRDGEDAEALSLTLAASRLHRMLRTATGPLMMSVNTMLAGRLAGRWMRMLAKRETTTPEKMEALHQELSQYDDSRVWVADSLRAELHFFTLPLIKILADARSLPELAAAIIRFKGDLSKGGDETADERVIRTLTSELLEGHPRPFDAKATVEALGESLAITIDALKAGKAPHRSDLPQEIKEANTLWPQEWIDALGMWTFFREFEGRNSEAREPLTAERKRRIRQDLRNVDNPLGKLLFLSTESDLFSPPLKTFDTDHRLTQVVLAGRFFWDRHQRVPQSLEELVQEQFLKSVPDDPFGEGPLQYDSRRALVWSIFHNGKNDRGELADFFNDDPDDERDDLASALPRF